MYSSKSGQIYVSATTVTAVRSSAEHIRGVDTVPLEDAVSTSSAELIRGVDTVPLEDAVSTTRSCSFKCKAKRWPCLYDG